MDSPEGHLPISAIATGHTADTPAMKQESHLQNEPLHIEEPTQHPHQEIAQQPDTPPVDEVAQRKLIEDMLRAEAAQAMAAENPAPRDIPMEMPVAPPPEPDSILNVPPPKKNFVVGILTGVKDGVVHLFEGLKKLLFSKKAEKPPKPTSFKNIQKPGAPVSFKQQPAGA